MLYHVTMSLDGYIAGPDDDMSWLAGHVGPNPLVDEFLPNLGALLIGAHTFGLAATAGGAPYGGVWTGPMFVLAPPPDPAPAGFQFVAGDLDAAVSTAKAAAGDKYVAILGANVAKRCLEAGLLDEILVHVAPLMLGDGTRLFEHAGGTNVALERIRDSSTPQAVNLWYRVAQRDRP